MKKAIFVTAALIFAVSVTALCYKFFSDYLPGAGEYDDIRETAVSYVPKRSGNIEADSDTLIPVIDTDALKKTNPDYAAWLYIPRVDISYPVTVSENNRDYLKRTFEGKKNSCGCLFFDMNTSPNLKRMNTIIHGHNMKDGSMFGRLKKYLSKSVEEINNEDIWLITENERLKFKIFSIYTTGYNDTEPYKYMFSSRDEFEEYIKNSLEKSEVKLKENDIMPILTLSTCSGKNKLIIQCMEEI